MRSDKEDFVVRRKLHSVAGESGQVDSAVAYEASLEKTFLYQGYNDTTCLVEIDEEPPRLINEDALNETLKIALLLNCEIYSATQIMRKTVIDGSNTSGFQRTVLIGHDGFIETSFGKVRIATIALEEDAARLVEGKKEKEVVYRLDRLGIPLVEISTYPDLKTPEQIKECALKLGDILRSCKVKRGLGTIRQDVNISIKGHDKVEIKGFQDPKMMNKTVEFEIERQIEDLENGKIEGEVRNALSDGRSEFLRPIPGAARMYPETDLPLLYFKRERLDSLKKQLPKLRHEIRDELKKKGVQEDLISLVLEELEEFEVLLKVYSKDANLIAKMVSLWRNEIATKSGKNNFEIKDILSERVLEIILEAVRDKKILESDVKKVMSDVAFGIEVEKAIIIERASEDELEEKILGIIKEKPGLRVNAYMGMIIQKLGAGIDKKKTMEILERILKN